MSAIRVLALLRASLAGGVAVALMLVDRLLGGHGPRLEIDEPGGGWQW